MRPATLSFIHFTQYMHARRMVHHHQGMPHSILFKCSHHMHRTGHVPRRTWSFWICIFVYRRQLQEQSQNGMFIMNMSVLGNLLVFQSADLRPYSAAASEHDFIYAKTSPGVKGRCKSAHCDAHTITPWQVKLLGV